MLIDCESSGGRISAGNTFHWQVADPDKQPKAMFAVAPKVVTLNRLDSATYFLAPWKGTVIRQVTVQGRSGNRRILVEAEVASMVDAIDFETVIYSEGPLPALVAGSLQFESESGSRKLFVLGVGLLEDRKVTLITFAHPIDESGCHSVVDELNAAEDGTV